MVLTFEPKEDFKQSDLAKSYREFINSNSFRVGALSALQHYSDILTRNPTNDPAAGFHKITGAREFLGILLNLTETVETPKTTVLQNLQRV